MYKVQVIADSTGKWCGNNLTFDNVVAAKAHAEYLFDRWTAVLEWRVVDENEKEEAHS